MKITNIHEIERFFKQYMVYDSCECGVISFASVEATNEDYEESDGIITFMYENLNKKSFSNLQEAITYLHKYGTIVYKQLGNLTFKDTILLLDDI